MPETHFGYRQVPLDHKQALVDDVFHKVARRYDLMNDLMSAGLHRAWKDALVTAINPPTKGRPGRLEETKGRPGRLEDTKGRPGRLEEKPERDFALLDVAGGTGDVSFRTIRAGGYGTRATVADINAEMLGVGRERAQRQGLDDAVTFVDANAESLPFPDKSFDAVSIAFGIRNVPRIDVALGEMYRVLKLGGRFLCLEFSNVDVPGLDALYELYSFNLVPAIGRAVVGDAEPYRYLVESIRRFPRPNAFADMMRAAGLKRVSHRVMSGGIVALHSGWRL
jgi:demethylmenaquinone methyltransferase/2-methoxy-6-polyprenyl-1,4-benzoquinol methylase